MTNFIPPRKTDAEVVAGWAADALNDGRYNLGQVLAKIAMQAEQHDRRMAETRRTVNVPWAGQTRNEVPARVYEDPRTSGAHLSVINGLGPSGNGDIDLQAAAIGVQLERAGLEATAVMNRPATLADPAPVVPDSARCVARVTREGVADECHGVAYWAPGAADGTQPGWRHVDPAVDAHHTPEINL